MVFERAAARLRDEFGSDPSPAVVERLVHRTHLPTALANPSDHYLLIRGDGTGRAPAVTFMAMEAAARSVGIPAGSPLLAALQDRSNITDIQAVSAAGEAARSSSLGTAGSSAAERGWRRTRQIVKAPVMIVVAAATSASIRASCICKDLR